MHPLTEIIANNPDDYPRRIYILTYGSVVARSVFTIDWGFPALMGKRLRVLDGVNYHHELRGVRPDGLVPLDDVVWIGPTARQLGERFFELGDRARIAGFRLLNWYEHPNYHDPHNPNPTYRRDARISRTV